MIKHKVSVIVPVYNSENYLRECLDSIVNQTLEDIEIICVNDGSTDSSLKIINEYAKKDDRFVILDGKNEGAGISRKKGLKIAKGEYVAFVDSDDFLDLMAFDKLYLNAKNNDSDCVLFKAVHFNEIYDFSQPLFDLEKVFESVNFNNFKFNYKDIKRYVLNKSFAPWTKLYKREFLFSYDDFYFPKNIIHQDIPLHVQVLLRAKNISYEPEYLYYYRTSNPKSITNNPDNKIFDIFRIINDVEVFLRENGYYDYFEIEFLEFKIGQLYRKIGQLNQNILPSNSKKFFIACKNEINKIEIEKYNISNYVLQKYNNIKEANHYEDFNLIENNSIKVSVIVPVYNVEDYLRECLNSILNQTLKDIEIICVNDGSTDNSLEILKEYVKYTKIKVFSHKKNKGTGATRNSGLKEAKGEYISFVDSDDFIHPHMLESLYKESLSHDLDMLIFQLHPFNKDSGNTLKYDKYYSLDILDDKFENTVFTHFDLENVFFALPVTPCNKLYKKKMLEDNKIKFAEKIIFEDNPFYFDCILSSKRVKVLKQPFYERRIHDRSIIETYISKSKSSDFLKATKLSFDVFLKHNLFEKYKINLYNKYINNINDMRLELAKNEDKNDFFNEIKNFYKKMNIDNETLSKLGKNTKDNYLYVLNSNNYYEYMANKNQDLKKQIKQLKNENQDLNKQINYLNIEKNKFKSLYESVLSSNIWKITEPFRKIRR